MGEPWLVVGSEAVVNAVLHKLGVWRSGLPMLQARVRHRDGADVAVSVAADSSFTPKSIARAVLGLMREGGAVRVVVSVRGALQGSADVDAMGGMGDVLRTFARARARAKVFDRAILDRFKRIDAGGLRLTLVSEPSARFSGLAVYEDADGWRYTAFFDAGDWDYMECVMTPDGAAYHYDGMVHDIGETVRTYSPECGEAWGLTSDGLYPQGEGEARRIMDEWWARKGSSDD